MVDEIIAQWDDHRKTLYAATQLNSKINETQKAIGLKKRVCWPGRTPDVMVREECVLADI